MIDSDQTEPVDHDDSAQPQTNRQKHWIWRSITFSLKLAIAFIFSMFVLSVLLRLLGKNAELVASMLDSGTSIWVWLMRYGIYAVVWFFAPIYLRHRPVSETDIQLLKRPLFAIMLACEVVVLINLFT